MFNRTLPLGLPFYKDQSSREWPYTWNVMRFWALFVMSSTSVSCKVPIVKVVIDPYMKEENKANDI